MYFRGSVHNDLDPIVVVGCSVGCLFRFICGTERHFGNAFQYSTVREKMQGILEMPSISG